MKHFNRAGWVAALGGALLVAPLPCLAGGVSLLWDEQTDGDLPFGLSGLSQPEIDGFTFRLSASHSRVRGESTGGESFLVVVPPGRELGEIRTSYDNTIDGNDHVLLFEPYPHASLSPPCQESMTHISMHAMDQVQPYQFSVVFASPAPSGTYLVRSTSSVSGLSNPAGFEIDFLLEDASLFYNGFSCRQFPDNPGS